ncbi:dihydrofolate reductase [Geopsychrobacter electrodiphilus]|uniref:dihydrofolate reductase n=1 Tax=Geopsychrobacter electrodiphilus TaxID=225196 RepID=UPI0012EB136F|nr:dihydrofolate reductase [Geopsychrobacter electrodiphilus]
MLLISIIVAMARNRCIGRDGRLPWHLSGDLQRFKQLTMGHSLLMGRKTFESIGRPLPGRTSYVLSRDAAFNAPGCHAFGDISAALVAAEAAGENELFVCGGEEIYRQMLPRCGRIYLTELEREVTGDAYFPPLPAEQFQRVRRVTLVEDETYTFSVYERRG